MGSFFLLFPDPVSLSSIVLTDNCPLLTDPYMDR